MPKTNSLDNIERIKKIDKSNMLSFCVNSSKHYEEAAKIARKFSITHPKPQKIIVAGMGGSAIGGELLKDWARDKALVPIEVEREYSLPAYADKNTLVFVVSYSGETEETLSVFLDAIRRGCMIVCVSSGGKLLEFAEKFGLSFIPIPSGMPPRAALPYLFMPLLIALEKIGLVSKVGTEISEAVKILEKVSSENSPEKPSSVNFSKTLALNINGTVPVVYGFGFYRSVAQRFKQQFNENSKIPSKWEFLPELNHNEIVGWEEAGKMAENFSAIFLRDGEEPKEIRDRIEVTKELMCKEKVKVFEVWSVGESRLAKMLSTISIGDFTSVYLALLRRVDPTPVKTIAMLKEKMKQSGVKEKILRELQKLAEK
ncbi:MAG: bifunctional phosphoglucose/phosphomannose isomerase [Candidatus Bathyarchaeia archaeon]